VEHPEVWQLLGKFMHQDFFLLYPDVCSGVREFVATVTPTQRADLSAHLAMLTGGDFSDEVMANAWWDSNAGIFPEPTEAREFMRQIEDCVRTIP